MQFRVQVECCSHFLLSSGIPSRFVSTSCSQLHCACWRRSAQKRCCQNEETPLLRYVSEGSPTHGVKHPNKNQLSLVRSFFGLELGGRLYGWGRMVYRINTGRVSGGCKSKQQLQECRMLNHELSTLRIQRVHNVIYIYTTYRYICFGWKLYKQCRGYSCDAAPCPLSPATNY